MTTIVPIEARRIAKELAALGPRRDKVLAHITPEEAAFLARNFGGDVSPVTGLPSFGFFDSITSGLGGLLGGGGGSSSAGNTAFSELSTQAKPVLTAGKNELNQYESGQLKGPDAEALQAQSQAAKARVGQFYAGSGLGNSSMVANQNNNIDFQTDQGRQTILNGYLSNANTLYGTGLGAYEAAVSAQYSGNVAAQQATAGALGSIFGNSNITGGIGNLFGSVGGLFGSSGGGTGLASDLGGATGGDGALSAVDVAGP